MAYHAVLHMYAFAVAAVQKAWKVENENEERDAFECRDFYDGYASVQISWCYCFYMIFLY